MDSTRIFIAQPGEARYALAAGAIARDGRP
jgi:hypothetical protein